jgi:SAM-dependent methyltransferase
MLGEVGRGSSASDLADAVERRARYHPRMHEKLEHDVAANARAKNASEGTTTPRTPTAARGEVFAILFVVGAAIMAVEILGTRVIGPVFGVNLFVWSALLSVTLGALAVGYYAGGVWVDRAPGMRILGFIVTAGGVLLGIVPMVSPTVLSLAGALGPRLGSLLAATCLFAPTLAVLGMLGPAAMRLTATGVNDAGRGAGSIYAISTAGSLAGTLGTGFLLVPTFDSDQILFGTATLLTLVGATSLARHWDARAFVAVVVPLIGQALPSADLPSGITVRDRAQSLYGLVEVIDDHPRGVRFLRADHSIIGAEFLRDHSPGFAFVHILEAARFMRPGARDALQIGLGIGSLPMALTERGIKVDVVELDPAVVRFAQKDFGFATRGDIFEEDARTFLARTSRRYDVIVHDTFSGGTTPEHLLSVEVVRRIHELLQPGGVLVLNFAGFQSGPKAEASFAVARTLRSVFPVVQVYRDSPPDDEPDEAGNLIFFASDAALDLVIPPDAQFDGRACEQTLRSFTAWRVLDQVPPGAVITDARNPLARLQLPIAEDHFYAMNKLLSPEVWLR